MTFYKALDGVQANNGGTYRYPGVGRATRHLDGDLIPCEYGYHLAKDEQVLDWLAPTLYIAEPCDEHDPIDAGDKWVTCRVTLVERLDTWNDRTARLFAADCAEGALLGERACCREPDGRSWAAIEVARRYANGEASDDARDAAWAAAWDAAGAAAWAAAWDSAGAAARAAARAAAWDAARDAARDALYERFKLYLDGSDLPPVESLYGNSRSSS